MTDDTGFKKGWKRLLVILCTLLLAGSVLLVFGVMGWAQDSENEAPQEDTGTEAETQEEGTETPAEEGQETGEEETISEEQPPTEEEGPTSEITIDFWEPELGTRTVYYVNDFLNDTHGQEYGTSELGYWDDYWVYDSTFNPQISVRWDFLDYSSYYYKSVAAISDMNPVYFDLEGPWYFNMTTPWKVVEEVIGIHEAADAHLYPEATYAKTKLIIGSGGHRIYMVEYLSNNTNEKTWNTWGYTMEFFRQGAINRSKCVIEFRSPHNMELRAPQVVRFPMMLGDTGSIESVYVAGAPVPGVSASGTYEVVAESEITVPGGTYDAVLVKYNMTIPTNSPTFSRISYQWFVNEVGPVVLTRSLPNILGPTYGEATGYGNTRGDYFYDSAGLMVLEEQTVPGGEEQK